MLKNSNSKSEPVSYQNLHITNFDVLHIHNFSLVSKINEHGVIHLSAVIPEGTGEEILARTSVGYPIGVYYSKDEKSTDKTFLFRGIVTEISTAIEQSTNYLYITAMSNTYNLDVNKQSQSFQDTSITYIDMLNKVLEQNVGATANYIDDASKAIGEFCIQYKETAWEFFKRMASRFYTGIYPNITSMKAELNFGCPLSQSEDLEVIDYNCYKDIKQYEEDSILIPNVSENDYIIYEVRSYALKKIGDKVNFQGKTWYVKEVKYKMEESLVIGRYKLCSKNGLKMKKYHNELLKGISLNGTCQGVERDKVKIQLQIDVEQRAKYLFPYSTMSASPDGSGWYCMPEKGDLLRVYFPNEEEKNCYAISSISSYSPENNTASSGASSGGASSVDRMGDPSVRYLRTVDNMEIKLTPEGITISADDGKAMIMLDKEGNILINGAKGIQMNASNNVNITAAKNINLFASKNISIKGENGGVELLESGKTKLTGEYVVEN